MTSRVFGMYGILCGLALAMPMPLAAQTIRTSSPAAEQAVQDPAEVYLTAYRLCRESENLAAKQSYNAAIEKGKQAEAVLARIVRDYPNWRSNLVSMRRRLLAENMANYTQKAKTARIPTGRQPGKPLSMEVTPTGIPLPTPEVNEAPAGGGESTYRPIELPDYNTTDKNLYNALARAQEECRRMAVAYRELNTKFEDVQKKFYAAQIEQKMYKERYDQLQEQVKSERAAGNKVVDSLSQQLAEMEARYHASEQARKDAEARVAELETTLSQTQEELARVTRERDALKAENEQLRAIVELNSPEKTKALLDQNLTLERQLKEAQARVKELEAQISGAGDQHAVLTEQLNQARAETGRLRDEMSGIYEENMGYRRRVSELSERLNNLEADLNSREQQQPLDPALLEENQLLRDVIAKQRRTLDLQEEGRQLLIDTYKQIKDQDPATLTALQKLDEQSSLDLTDAEKRLIETVKKAPPVPENAEALATQAVRESLELETLANLAAKAFAKGRYTAAEQLYRTLNDSQPDHVAGLVNLGTILLYRNNGEEAVEFFHRASRLAPDLAISYYLAGICYYRMDRLEEAQRMFARTIELDPANAEAFFYLANIEGINSQYEVALNHFAAAVKLKPELGDAHYNMARLYAETNKIPEAARAYDRAIKHGAEPDPEFENFLRSHPDSARKPGEDLVETIHPEEEAEILRQQDPELQELLKKHAEEAEKNPEPLDPANPDVDPVAESTEPLPQTPDDPFLQQLQALRKDIPAAPTPSSAGKGHETDKKLFSTVRVRTRNERGRRIRVKLRLKRPEPQRIRERGGEIRELKQREHKK